MTGTEIEKLVRRILSVIWLATVVFLAGGAYQKARDKITPCGHRVKLEITHAPGMDAEWSDVSVQLPPNALCAETDNKTYWTYWTARSDGQCYAIDAPKGDPK